MTPILCSSCAFQIPAGLELVKHLHSGKHAVELLDARYRDLFKVVVVTSSFRILGPILVEI